MKFSEKEKERLFRSIYNGEVGANNLPKNLYEAIATHLSNGVKIGLGSSEGEIFYSLNENIHIFSGAKTYWQVEEMNALSTESFDEFKELANEVYDKYNTTWLEAEYNTTVGQSQSVRAWIDIQSNKEVLPYLRYSAVDDPNTSEICLGLNGLVKPVDDPVWDVYSPLNHYNCRCLLEQIDGEETDLPSDLEEPEGVFSTNPGKTKEIFNKEHPYFDIPKKDRELAKENFNLPLPNNE